MRMSFVLGTAIALSTVTPVAMASGGAGHERVVEHIFRSADLDESGSLDANEYEKAGLSGMGVSFEDCDANDDGATSLEEYLDLYRKHHPPRDGLTA